MHVSFHNMQTLGQFFEPLYKGVDRVVELFSWTLYPIIHYFFTLILKGSEQELEQDQE